MAIGDLNGDGAPDILLHEQSRKSMVFLTYERATRTLKPRMKFRVFETKTFGRGSRGRRRVEPRVMEVADVTGDGRNDLILLIHDRINVYPQD